MDKASKLEILGAAARYDASCSSSGGGRQGKPGQLGNAYSAGICHTWAADGRCVSLLKVLLSNACRYDCAYCMNRCSSDSKRAAFEPRELADITVEFYRRNYIEGLFLSSGVLKSPDYTMELMVETMRILREEYKFGGYIHAKIIPSANPTLVNAAGLLADRISVNIELPSSSSLRLLAPDKNADGIFSPMNHIHRVRRMSLEDGKRYKNAPLFAPAGQVTQMIVGATAETDLSILRLSHGLYKKYQMKRVYFSAYIPVNDHPSLPPPGTPPPLVREHRLYQADWLMRFYYFSPEEILDESAPLLDMELDPKCSWALRHPEFFPVEINTAPYESLLRIPGVGVISARRILENRRNRRIRYEDLRKIGLVMKRAKYFLTVDGRFYGTTLPGNPYLKQLLSDSDRNRQLSLFETPQTALPSWSPPQPAPVLVPAAPAILPAAPAVYAASGMAF